MEAILDHLDFARRSGRAIAIFYATDRVGCIWTQNASRRATAQHQEHQRRACTFAHSDD
jgi:hypothetical protein